MTSPRRKRIKWERWVSRNPEKNRRAKWLFSNKVFAEWKRTQDCWHEEIVELFQKYGVN